MLLGIKWYHFVVPWNDDIQRQTKQLKLTAIIQARQLTLFGHIARMDDNVDAKRILLALPQGDWRRPPGHPRITWLSSKHHPTWSEMSQSHTPWSSRHGSESPCVEVAVDIRCYVILELHARNHDDVLVEMVSTLSTNWTVTKLNHVANTTFLYLIFKFCADDFLKFVSHLYCAVNCVEHVLFVSNDGLMYLEKNKI